MFTGIIETIGTVTAVHEEGTNRSFQISSSLSHELKVDQSVSHNGACLTVEQVAGDQHRVTAIAETLKKTNLQFWKPGEKVNLERSLLFNGRIDGHLVQGHVDAMVECIDRKDLAGSWELRFAFPEIFSGLTIEKGSICINGISLTIFNVTKNECSVAIIPYTFDHTNISGVLPGMKVNVEFDMMGKYAQRIISASYTINAPSLHER